MVREVNLVCEKPSSAAKPLKEVWHCMATYSLRSQVRSWANSVWKSAKQMDPSITTSNSPGATLDFKV